MKKLVLSLTFALSLLFTTESFASPVNIPVQLPYEGIYNDWSITFYDVNTTDYYYFYLSDYDITINSSGHPTVTLDAIPEGTYNIEFSSPYNWVNGFRYEACGVSDYDDYENTLYNVNITTADPYIYIDQD